MSDVTVSPKKSLLTPGKLGLSFNVTQWRLYIKDKITRDTKSPISNCLCLRQLSLLFTLGKYLHYYQCALASAAGVCAFDIVL